MVIEFSCKSPEGSTSLISGEFEVYATRSRDYGNIGPLHGRVFPRFIKDQPGLEAVRLENA